MLRSGIRRTRAGISIARGGPQEGLGFHGADPVPQRSNANQAAVAGAAGGAYTAAEQTILNNVVTLANELRAAMVEKGLIKGS